MFKLSGALTVGREAVIVQQSVIVQQDVIVQHQSPRLENLFSCSTQLSMKFYMLISIHISRKSALFQAHISLDCYFFLLINVKMPTTVGILTFMRRKDFMLS